MLRNLLLLLSTAVGEVMAMDGRFLDLSANVMVHVEAIIVTTLITTARVYKRESPLLPALCYEHCSKYAILRSRYLHLSRLANQCLEQTRLSTSQRPMARFQQYAGLSALLSKIVRGAFQLILQIQEWKLVV